MTLRRDIRTETCIMISQLLLFKQNSLNVFKSFSAIQIYGLHFVECLRQAASRFRGVSFVFCFFLLRSHICNLTGTPRDLVIFMFVCVEEYAKLKSCRSKEHIILTINLCQKLPLLRDITKSMFNGCPHHLYPISPTEREFELANLPYIFQERDKQGRRNPALLSLIIRERPLTDIFHRDPSRSPMNLPKAENSHKFS